MSEVPVCFFCEIYRSKGLNKKCEDCKNKELATSESDSILNTKNAKTIGMIDIGAVATVGIATVALPVIGFTAGGVAAGSIAATIQSSIGAVGAGSVFATLQSAGAVGLSAGAQAIIGGIGAVGAGIADKIYNNKKQDDMNENDNDNKTEIEDVKEDINMDNYEEWNSQQLIEWIISLDPETYKQYEQILTKSLIEEQVSGDCMNDIDISDIKRWGIMNFKHSKGLMRNIQLLIENKNKSNDDEGKIKAISLFSTH